MSELINNREYRQNELKKVMRRLHEGASAEEVQKDFARVATGISASALAEMEQSLVADGLPVEEIQRLCDVHAALYRSTAEEIHARYATVPAGEDTQAVTVSAKTAAVSAKEQVLGVFRDENRQIEAILGEKLPSALSGYAAAGASTGGDALAAALAELARIDLHYARKENLIFPILERNGITAPPQVMWGVDDDIRRKIKAAAEMAAAGADAVSVREKAEGAAAQIREMIYKEENILFPMAESVFGEADWESVRSASPEVGFMAGRPDTASGAPAAETAGEGEAAWPEGEIPFDAGSLLPEEANAMLNTIPIDITFVDANDRVKYFTQGKDRIFARPKTVLGREVRNCHPPKSVHIVEQIVSDFKTGKKDHEDFWIRMGEKFVYIRYYAVRGASGNYLGTLEVTQDIGPIVALEGEKRLMS